MSGHRAARDTIGALVKVTNGGSCQLRRRLNGNGRWASPSMERECAQSDWSPSAAIDKLGRDS